MPEASGYIAFDEDGEIGDGLSDEIEYSCDGIIDALNEITKKLEIKANEALNQAKDLSKSIL